MRKHTLYLLLAGWGLLAASCYDDKSTLQTTHIPPVEIEVPEAIASQLTVVHNARLDITGIRITKDGRENPEELTYEWTVSQTDNDSEAISLATTREFHEVIDLPISSKGYLFLLTVTDTAHDLKYQYKWTLIVTAQFNEGLVVAYTRDGTTSDLGLIMHPQLTETYSGAEQGTVEKELISRRNGSPFPSAVTHMLYTYDKTDKKNILWVSTDDDLMRVETDYYEILGHKEDAFVYLPGKLDIRSLLNTYQCTMILNDGDIYETLLSRGRISTPVSGTETMTVDNGVVSAHSAPGSTRKPSTIFYDREQGKFCYGYNQTFYACGSVGSSPFDPGNAPGLRCIAGGISIDNATHTLLMRKADGNHALYTFGNYSASAGAPAAKLIYEIPAEANALIAEAELRLLAIRPDPLHRHPQRHLQGDLHDGQRQFRPGARLHGPCGRAHHPGPSLPARLLRHGELRRLVDPSEQRLAGMEQPRGDGGHLEGRRERQDTRRAADQLRQRTARPAERAGVRRLRQDTRLHRHRALQVARTGVETRPMPQMFSERLRHFFIFLIIFASVSPPKSGGNRPKQKKHQDGPDKCTANPNGMISNGSTSTANPG